MSESVESESVEKKLASDPRYQLLRDKLDRLRRLQESIEREAGSNSTRGMGGFADRVIIEVVPAQDRSQES